MPKQKKSQKHSEHADEIAKGPAWHTAFFNLAECLRKTTGGALNHKVLYALVSTDGRYINHKNPAIRKRTAGTLSRIIHSKAYVADMRAAYSADNRSFDKSATQICSALRDARSLSDEAAIAWLVDECWPEIRRGLENEAREWRWDLDPLRLDYEMAMLFDFYRGSPENPIHQACADASDDTASLLSAILYAIAFGHLRVQQSRNLVDAQTSSATPLTPDARVDTEAPRACLVRFSDPKRTAISGFWIAESSEPFTIGRYTDCTAIEFSPEVSRLHCKIHWEDGRWLLEDTGSRNGCKILRGEALAFPLNSSHDDSDGKKTLPLEFGDIIELPSGSAYLFTADDRWHR